MNDPNIRVVKGPRPCWYNIPYPIEVRHDEACAEANYLNTIDAHAALGFTIHLDYSHPSEADSLRYVLHLILVWLDEHCNHVDARAPKP
jgi:hypothetical protein